MIPNSIAPILPAKAMALKVNFGCGENKLEGWKNHDSELDITKPLPYRDNTVEMILIEHVVEHVSSGQALQFFREARRILKPKGVLRVCIPVLDKIPDKQWAADLIEKHGHVQLLCKETLTHLLSVAGFSSVQQTGRSECDGHWKIIGKERDDAETLRMEATK